MQVLESPGKSWKSINSCKKKFLSKEFSAVLFLDIYFVRVCCFSYCALGDLEKSI